MKLVFIRKEQVCDVEVLGFWGWGPFFIRETSGAPLNPHLLPMGSALPSTLVIQPSHADPLVVPARPPPTPAPPHRVPSPDHTEMLLLCSLGSPVQGQVCPEALSTLVLGLSPRA